MTVNVLLYEGIFTAATRSLLKLLCIALGLVLALSKPCLLTCG